MHHQFEAAALQRIEHAVLHVDDVLRGRIVEHQPHQERAPEGQATGLRIGLVAALLHQCAHAFASVLAHQRRVVEHARYGLLRHARKPRDVVDGGLADGLRRRRRGRFPVGLRSLARGGFGSHWIAWMLMRSIVAPRRRRKGACPIKGPAIPCGRTPRQNAPPHITAAPQATTATATAPASPAAAPQQPQGRTARCCAAPRRP